MSTNSENQTGDEPTEPHADAVSQSPGESIHILASTILARFVRPRWPALRCTLCGQCSTGSSRREHGDTGGTQSISVTERYSSDDRIHDASSAAEQALRRARLALGQPGRVERFGLRFVLSVERLGPRDHGWMLAL